MKRISLFFIASFGLIAITHAQTKFIFQAMNLSLPPVEGGTANISHTLSFRE